MNTQTASYYRALLFGDPTADSQPLPKSLMRLHTWAENRHMAMGLGGMISKAVAITVAMTWLSSTEEGRKFSAKIPQLNGLFDVPLVETEQKQSPETESQTDVPLVKWKEIAPDTPVLANVDGSWVPGIFKGQRGSWLDIFVGDEEKHLKIHQVQLATKV